MLKIRELQEMERKFGIELEIVGITQDAAIKALKAVQIKVNAET